MCVCDSGKGEDGVKSSDDLWASYVNAFLHFFPSLQGYCLNVFQPSGAGRKRRRRRRDLIRSEELVRREDRRNFFPIGGRGIIASRGEIQQQKPYFFACLKNLLLFGV